MTRGKGKVRADVLSKLFWEASVPPNIDHKAHRWNVCETTVPIPEFFVIMMDSHKSEGQVSPSRYDE